MDNLSAMNAWQANLTGTALCTAGLLLFVLGLYATEKRMQVVLRLTCLSFGTAMFVGGIVLAVW